MKLDNEQEKDYMIKLEQMGFGQFDENLKNVKEALMLDNSLD
jgi:hypothetical protein